jgi:hypothetical protein
MLEQKRKALREIQARKSLIARSHWPGLARVSRPTLGTHGNAVKTEFGPRPDRDLTGPLRESPQAQPREEHRYASLGRTGTPSILRLVLGPLLLERWPRGLRRCPAKALGRKLREGSNPSLSANS